MSFTNDEMNLMCIYNTGTREGTLNALTAMREYLTAEETELRDMTTRNGGGSSRPFCYFSGEEEPNGK